jgi:hypothetical protein
MIPALFLPLVGLQRREGRFSKEKNPAKEGFNRVAGPGLEPGTP